MNETDHDSAPARKISVLEADAENYKENNDDGNLQSKYGKKSKRHKKKRMDETDLTDPTDSTTEVDLIIPVSPGLAIDIDYGVGEMTAGNGKESTVKMETRGSKEAVNFSGMRAFRSSFS